MYNKMSEEKLEILLKKFQLFTQKLDRNHDEFEIISQRYDYYKKKIQSLQSNSHLIECNLQYISLENYSTDICSCYYIKQFPQKLCEEVLDLIGLDYLINF